MWTHSLLSTLYLHAVPSAAAGCPDISFTPFVVASISAANTLLLLVSLVIFIASCAILRRAKRSRRKHIAVHTYDGKSEDTVHDYEAVDDVVKVRMANGNTQAVTVCDNVDDLSLSTQCPELDAHTSDNPHYAAVTICTTQ